MKARSSELVAVFLAACGSLLFEISVTKIFEFSLWSRYAYLVIGTAMFGLGMSGVILTRWPRLLGVPAVRFLAGSTVASGLTMFIGFLAVNYVPIHVPEAPDGWARELLHVGVVFFALSLPFVSFGMVMSYLFEHRGESANTYYFADLLGAGIGSFLLVPLIPILEPQGLVLLCSLLCLAAAALFGLGGPGRRRRTVPFVAASIAALAIVGVVWTPVIARQIPLEVHANKRNFKKDLDKGRIVATGWSALSRVDIVPWGKRTKRVWIAGGVNASWINQFDGDFEKLREGREGLLQAAARSLNPIVLPHLSKVDHTVCMIGTSGGGDSLRALEAGARKVTGVEMDPRVADFVTRDYSRFAGGLFLDGNYSELIVDEGRSWVRRSGRKFDVIQQVNNFTPVAFANGSLNLSENYLLTVESFRDFYDHLTDDGILCINRYGAIRLLSTAVEMFRRMGLAPEEYSRHLVVCGTNQSSNSSCLVKKSAFTREEVDRIFQYFEETGSTRLIVYAPYRTAELPKPRKNLYVKIATSPDPRPYWRVGAFDFSPATDARPFFNHVKVLGQSDEDRNQLDLLPEEVKRTEEGNVLGGRVPKGDLPPLVVLLEALVLSSVFFGAPLLSKKDLRGALKGQVRTLGYFACLGVAFILIEICLIQRLVLFLGSPVYSISTVLGSLLVSAGLGSLVSGRLKPEARSIRWLLVIIAVTLIAVHFSMPILTQIFLGTSFPTRLLVAILITGIPGFLMGMPMPIGIRYLKASGKEIVSWAWAINGYFTVIGSAASVVIAVNLGFVVVFLLAAAIYAAALFFLGDARGTSTA